MSSLDFSAEAIVDSFANRRAIALANIRHFRRLAQAARLDGLPKADLRAANAKRAARIVLAAAKAESKRYRPVRDVLLGNAEPLSV
ncbi:hypothetical protein [Methylobacterium aerolatum]|uniref:Uncharacterized protein n=1 Tax=Methylobacterium aerolatum TaxID=418708 RepID=A0ABU0HY50_9HYPH|nr:hypothetical protein [Methylobacterium aerolatum]MDQ0447272.1 hypothetical protein [Methylobacterium aerolatum]GJD36940.1 hypothetical protein FMGBMHLM_3865 [Methylobacterium aerolatum]